MIDDNMNLKVVNFSEAINVNVDLLQQKKTSLSKRRKTISKLDEVAILDQFEGNLTYSAPELLQQEEPSLAVDIWALGIILF